MKKFLLFFTVCCIAVFIFVFKGFGYYLNSETREFLPQVVQQIESDTPFSVSRLDFKKSKLTSLKEFSWIGLEGTLVANSHPFIKKGTQFDFYLQRLGVRFSDYQFRDFLVRGVGFSLESNGASAPDDFNKLIPESNTFRDGELGIDNFQYEFRAEDESDSVSARQLGLNQISELYPVLSDGVLPEDFVFEGVINIALNNKNYRLRLHWLEEDGAKKIILLENDLQQVNADFKTWLTREEIKIVSRNPLKAPKLLQIKYYAEKKADEKMEDSDDASYHAYRYVLWSYLLAREFGSEIAESVTEAHETGVPYQSAEAKRMDVVNGRKGREYFLSGVDETELVSKVKTDPEIVRVERTL
jgi:hypothetical protein